MKKEPTDIIGELDYLLGDKSRPLSQAFYNKYNLLPPKPFSSIASKPYVHERQLKDHPFVYVNPNLRGKQLDDHESSVERKTPSNSTFYSNGDNYFHEILLTWEKPWTNAKMNEVTE